MIPFSVSVRTDLRASEVVGVWRGCIGDRGASILVIAAVEFLAARRFGLKGRSPVLDQSEMIFRRPSCFLQNGRTCQELLDDHLLV